ncbi:MAG: hypothetical protein R3285_09130, partial [Kiloniellales bacterium]|nr:hypothetical protein [Kiloniellales bacterium]
MPPHSAGIRGACAREDALAEPLLIHEGRVRSDWIDYNGHMRDGYYVVVCSDATDNLMDHFGIDQVYRDRTQRTAFT